MRALLLMAMVACGCGKGGQPTTAPEPEPEARQPEPKEAPKPTPKLEPKQSDQPPKIVQPEPKPKPEPKKPPTFQESWDEAWRLAATLDATEPAETKKALGILTNFEKLDAEELMHLSRSVYLPDGTRELIKLGCVSFVRRESRKVAKDDAGFRAAMEKFWSPGFGSRGVLAAAGAWGAIDRFARADVLSAVKDNTPTGQLDPETRNVILRLGGADWLRR